MFILIKYSFRNLFRRRFRSVTVFCAVGSAAFILIFFRGLSDGGYEQMAKISTRIQAGKVVISHPEWLKTRQPDKLIPFDENIRRNLQDLTRKIKPCGRIILSGSIKTESGEFNTDYIAGVNYFQEKETSDIEQFLLSGSFNLTGAIMSHSFADKTNLKIGDTLIVFTGDWPENVFFRIPLAATLKDGWSGAENWVLVPLNLLQNKLKISNAVNMISFSGGRFRDERNIEHLISKLKIHFKNTDIAISPWWKVMPMVNQFIDYHSASVWIFQIFIFFIVSIAIANAMIMSVMERKKEISVLRALGASKHYILTQISVESLILTFSGGLTGVLAGLGLNWWLSKVGLDPGIFNGGHALEIAGGTFSRRIFPLVDPAMALYSLTFIVSLGLLGGLMAGAKILGTVKLTDSTR
ncbi:MAG: FtsX-like permease family protein [Deltaproteobacteria bacterium]|nr:FtsX-like permease family protein [Deltaproteobacteria bacterium]